MRCGFCNPSARKNGKGFTLCRKHFAKFLPASTPSTVKRDVQRALKERRDLTPREGAAGEGC